MRVTGGARHLLEIETRWTMLPPPPSPEDPAWEERWRYLFQTYAPAIRGYVAALLRRMTRATVDEAEVDDVVQDYLSACVDKGWLSRDAGTIRSFRRYLKTQVYRFTCDYLDRKFASKRDARRTLGDEMIEAVGVQDDDPAVRALDEGVVAVALDQALARLSRASEDQAEVIRDLLRTGGEGSADLGARLGRPPRQLPVLRHRARRAFATLLAEELKSTVRDLDAFSELLTTVEAHLP